MQIQQTLREQLTESVGGVTNGFSSWKLKLLTILRVRRSSRASRWRDRGRTSEIALAVTGYHPATFSQATDCQGLHDLWIFEGLLSRGNSELHVTSIKYNDPIALKLVQISRRCLSLHGLSDAPGRANIQIGGADTELSSFVLEELTAAGISAALSGDENTNGSDPSNICNKTTISAGVQLEMVATYRESLFAPGCNTRELRKNNTTAAFCRLAAALRKALSRTA